MTWKCVAWYKELQWEKSDTGTDTLFHVLNMYNGVLLHLTEHSIQHLENVSVNLFSAFYVFSFCVVFWFCLCFR